MDVPVDQTVDGVLRDVLIERLLPGEPGIAGRQALRVELTDTVTFNRDVSTCAYTVSPEGNAGTSKAALTH